MTFLFISLSLYFVQMSAQTPRQKKEAADLVYAQAINAYKQGKIQDAIDQFTAFLNMRPNYINAEFNIAQLSAALGKTDISYRYLNKLAAYGMNLNPANFEDPDLQKIPAQQLAEIKSKFVLNQELKGDAEIVFQLDERDLITESVVIDQRNGDSYISSVRKRKIIRKKKNGKFEDFSAESDNLWAVFSLKISPDGRYLWASSSATREMLNADTNLTDQTAMFRYNLKTAKLDKRFSLPSDHKAHIWGDFVFAADGLLYISDSVDNTIYVLNPESGEFKKLLNSFYFSSLQGLVFNEKETLLFVADYSEGIYAIDMTNLAVNQLTYPDNLALRGLDGLYFYKNSLIASQNGFRPNRIIQLQLDTDQKSIVGYHTLIANHPLIADPTLGQIVDDQFYFIANSQWSMVKPDGSVKAVSELEKPSILKVRLNK